MHLSAGTKAAVLHASLSYTARTNATEKKGAGAKKKRKRIIIIINKAISPLTCDLRGCPLCIHEVQTDLKTALSLAQTPPPPPTHPPPRHQSVAGGSHYTGADTSDITHSLAS